MKSELEKLSDNNLIALCNYLALIGIKIGLAEESDYYEYESMNADFSLFYPIYKESDLMYTIKQTFTSDVRYSPKFNFGDMACTIEYDRLISLTRQRLITIINGEIHELLCAVSPYIDKQQIGLTKAIEHISRLVDGTSLLNGVQYLA